MKIERLTSFLVWALLAAGLVIAVAPERPAKLLTTKDGWSVQGEAGRVRLDQFPPQFRHIRASVLASEAGVLHRSWTPELGVSEVELVSAPFRAPRNLIVAVTGATRTPSGRNSAYLSCSSHAHRHPVFLGSVNVAAVEALLRLPPDWCKGDARLHLVAEDRSTNVGLGAAYEVSALSLWKASFLGLLPYLAIALIIPSLIGWTAAGASRRLTAMSVDLPIAAVAAGLAALASFYLYSVLPRGWGWLALASLAILSGLLATVAGKTRLRESRDELRPYAVVWALGSVAYFTLLAAAHNGLGHWDPNYRFWPAMWSSDNELPWMFAEAVRLKQDLAGLYGGGWKPTDRPPLMAGAHLLVADLFALLQVGNDGEHLKGLAFNAAAIVFSTAWLPAALHLLRSSMALARRDALAVLTLVAILPFSIFNSIYGWPKGFGAGFGLIATALAFAVVRATDRREIRMHTLLFGLTSALSLLAHSSNALFLVPLGFWLFLRRLRHHWGTLALGALAGIALLTSWSLYKLLVLPSHDPVTRYALVGDYGFDAPQTGVLAMLADRYGAVTLAQWLEIKVRMLLQPLWPLSTSVVPVGLNADFAAAAADRLRAWDSILLSAGNLPILIGTGFVAWQISSGSRDGRNSSPCLDDVASWQASSTLIRLGLTTWALLALLFLAPLILHVWPYTAVFGLALGGLATVRRRAPSLFYAIGLATLVYAGVVWGLLPLRSALGIELLPLLLLGLVAAVSASTVIRPAFADRLGKLVSATMRARKFREPIRPAAPVFRFAGGQLSWGDPMAPEAKVSGRPRLEWSLRITAFALAAFFLYFAVISSGRPLIDDHSFRQTQTAISVYHILNGGPLLDYITPVLGAPWSIPFEAPVYHWSAALLALFLPMELGGKLASAIYLIGAVWLAYRFLRLLTPGSSLVPVTFAVVALASPLHLFWGRAFLIESCALFFGMAHLYLGARFVHEGRPYQIGGSIAAGALCALAKSTTWPAFIVALSVYAAWHFLRSRHLHLVRLAGLAFIGVVPLVAATIWTAHSDALKQQNPLGDLLTSASLKAWNFGTVAQRIGPDLWSWSLPLRMLPDILGSLWILAVLPVLYLAVRGSGQQRGHLLLFILAFLFPLLLFTNLHLVHNYYQVANASFALMALALALGTLMDRGKVLLGLILTFAIVLGQVVRFSNHQWQLAFSANPHDQIVQASRWVKHNARPGAMLAVGVEWSPIAHYYAQRMGIAVPTWAPDRRIQETFEALDLRLGGLSLTAIIDCRPMKQGTYTALQTSLFDRTIDEFTKQSGVLMQASGDCRSWALPGPEYPANEGRKLPTS